MRIGVIGAGAVGGALAALLSRAGHEVEVTARGSHLAEIAARGIQLTGAWGEYTAIVEAGELLTRPPELVIVATKAHDAIAAIRQNLRVVDRAPLLVVQNGLNALESGRVAAPASEVVGGLAIFASSYLAPGQITVTTAGPIYLGAASEAEVRARSISDVLNGVLPCSVPANFVGAQWTKLVINQVNALPAITGLSVQEVVATAQLRRIMTASMRETVRVGLATGIRFETLQSLGPTMLWLFSTLPLFLGQVLPAVMSARIGATPNPGSTLQSIRRGQATEIDYLNGAVVLSAQKIGVAAPVNSTLVELVHEVETSGEFLSPGEVITRFKDSQLP